MLESADIGDFSEFGDGPVNDLGLKGIAPHPIDALFLGGWSRMWITSMALTGHYRAENDAWAHSLGYPIQDLPLVPLEGSIVTDHPTEALEVYERVLAFRDAAGASQWLDIVRGSGQPASAILTDPRLGDEVLALIEPSSLDGTRVAETVISVSARTAGTVVTVSVRGGVRLSIDQVTMLVVKAVSTWQAACPG
jgi:hypothetical protein